MLRRLGIILIGLIVLALIAGVGAFYVYQQSINTPLALEEDYRLQVPQGASLRRVATELEAEGVLPEALWLRVYGRVSGKASQIKAGEYALPVGTTPVELLDKLVSGEVVQYQLTIVEGWTFAQLMTVMAQHEALEHTLQGLDGAEIMQRLGTSETHPEGWFYPETYRFPRGTTDLAFLRRAHQMMRQRLEQEWEGRAEGLPLKSPYEALILASIIERETGVPSERDRIAGVFVRRLQRGMRLQTDPTVIYGMGDAFDGDIRYRDLRRDTPYNTYTRSGLPPTPIAMPSGEALHAALHPADGDELYFVSRGDGSHVFSATLEEHNRAVRRYQLGGK